MKFYETRIHRLKIALLTEAGAKVGYGHISRIRALAHFLWTAGFGAQIFIAPEDSFEALADEKLLDWRSASIKGFDFVVIDSYLADAPTYARLAKNRPALFFDDAQRIKYPKGIILNGALGAENIYEKDAKHRYLLGEKYLLLRPEFQNPKESHAHKITNVLLTLGAKDIRNLSPSLIESIRRYDPNVRIHQIITDAYDEADQNITYHKNLTATDVANVMRSCDIAVTAGGQSLVELCALGIPTLSITIADNQKNNIAYLAKESLTHHLGSFEDKNLSQNLIAGIEKLAKQSIRENISAALKKRIKPNSGANIAKKIGDYYADCKLKKNMTLQKMPIKNFINLDFTEAVDVLAWRNEESTAKNMIHSDFIPLDAHLDFIESLKKRSDKYYFKIADIGAVTIEDVDFEDDSASFGIYKNPKAQKVGKLLIQIAEILIFKKLKLGKIKIVVKKHNQKAQNLYIKSGYFTYGEEDDLLLMEKVCTK